MSTMTKDQREKRNERRRANHAKKKAGKKVPSRGRPKKAGKKSPSGGRGTVAVTTSGKVLTNPARGKEKGRLGHAEFRVTIENIESWNASELLAKLDGFTYGGTELHEAVIRRSKTGNQYDCVATFGSRRL